MSQFLDTDGTSPPGHNWAALTAELDGLREDGRWLPGPATMLEVIGRSAFEADHERLIAWLLNPLAPHNLGSAVLEAMLRRVRPRPDAAGVPAREELSRSRVRRQDVRAKSRPDIVVETPQCTLVIELKIYAVEGDGQTNRQADDYAGVPSVVYVFLTLRDQRPRDSRFLHVLLRDFAVDLRRVLDSAPQPASAVATGGRAVAADYLATLERMLGMNPVDEDAARFWLKHSKDMTEARKAAQGLLAYLPERSRPALESLAADLGEDFAVFSFNDVSTGSNGIGYSERTVLLARRSWVHQDGKVRLGIGLGQSLKPDPDDTWHRPFCGIYASDPQVYSNLREAWEPKSRPWGNWVLWRLLKLDPPHDHSDLLGHYARAVADQGRRDWEENRSVLELAMDHSAP